MEQEFRFNPVLELQKHQQAELAATCATPGYKVIHLILRSIVDNYMIDLQNVPVENTTEIIAKHGVSKTAVQIYSAMTDRINEEVVQYMAALPDTNGPSDPTEALLDIGPLASNFRDLEVEGYESFEESYLDGE